MNPNKIFELLACPGSDEILSLVATKVSSGVPYFGWLVNSNGNAVAELKEFKFDFCHFDRCKANEELSNRGEPVEVEPEPLYKYIGSRDKWIEYHGEWQDIESDLRVAFGNKQDSRMRFRTKALNADILFHAHPWSGIAVILLNGDEFLKIDLYNPSNPLTRRVKIENPLPGSEMCIEVHPSGLKNSESYDRQVIIEGINEQLNDFAKPKYKKHRVRNFGGAEFSEQFHEYLRDLPSDAVVLDVGGGRRQINDDRYINLEYSLYDEPDIYGDAQALPFKSNSVDLVYCTGVLEHVPDLQKAAKEIYRVLKPQGRALVCMPFIQPLHNEPQHFFNATSFGLEELFKDFKSVHLSWPGEFFDTIKWLAEAAHLNHLPNNEGYIEFLRLAKELSINVPYERLKFVASANWINAIK